MALSSHDPDDLHVLRGWGTDPGRGPTDSWTPWAAGSFTVTLDMRLSGRRRWRHPTRRTMRSQ